MMTQKQWEQGLEAWEKIKTQATIDLEQAELYIKSINEKLKTIGDE